MAKQLSRIILIVAISTISCAGHNETDVFWKAWLDGKYAEAAEAAWDRAENEDKPEYYLLSAICYQNVGQYYRASLGSYYFSQADGAEDAVVELLNAKLEQHPRSFRIYLASGIAATMEPGLDLDDAKTYFEKSLELERDNPYALNYLAMICLHEGKLEQAVEYAEKSIELKPDMAEPYVNLGGAYYEQGKEDEALDILLEGMATCPSIPGNAHASLKNLVTATIPSMVGYYMIGVPAIIEDNVRFRIIGALKPNPRNYLEFAEHLVLADNTIDVGVMLDSIEPGPEFQDLYDYVNARAFFVAFGFELSNTFDSLANRLIESRWDDYERILEIGLIYYEFSEYENSLRFHEAGYEHVPDWDRWYGLKYTSNIGTMYLQMGDLDEASKWMNAALEIEPADPITLVNLGIVYYMQEENDKSLEIFRRADECCETQSQRETVDKYLQILEE